MISSLYRLRIGSVVAQYGIIIFNRIKFENHCVYFYQPSTPRPYCTVMSGNKITRTRKAKRSAATQTWNEWVTTTDSTTDIAEQETVSNMASNIASSIAVCVVESVLEDWEIQYNEIEPEISNDTQEIKALDKDIKLDQPEIVSMTERPHKPNTTAYGTERTCKSNPTAYGTERTHKSDRTADGTKRARENIDSKSIIFRERLIEELQSRLLHLISCGDIGSGQYHRVLAELKVFGIDPYNTGCKR